MLCWQQYHLHVIVFCFDIILQLNFICFFHALYSLLYVLGIIKIFAKLFSVYLFIYINKIKRRTIVNARFHELSLLRIITNAPLC